jgi:predicted PhzF superfamily epimerase YddE/YHI9
VQLDQSPDPTVIRIQVVDSFTEAPFGGNPAAVTLLDRFPPDDWMQLVAREMNLSETAFVVPRADGDHDLRWFTPAIEVDLCGHATLASAHLLGGTARFHTRSGVLSCNRTGSGLIEMDFPADRPTEAAVPPAFKALPVRSFGAGRHDAVMELPDANAVRHFGPDIAAIAALPYRGLAITAPGDEEGVDFVSRFFGPAVGIPEDPVTGSAHCMLSPFWARRLGRLDLVGYQASPRGGTVYTRLEGDRVVIGGHAVTISEVNLLFDPQD